MKQYIIRRLLLIVPMLIGISFIMFIIMHLAPGDPTAIKYGLNSEVSETAKLSFDKMYALDKPILVQYGMWMKRFFSMDFGISFVDGQPVMSKILSRLPATLLLQLVSLFMIFCIAIPIGMISAMKRNSLFDRVTTILVFIGYAMPGFWFALLLVYLFGFRLNWFPISGMSPWYSEYLNTFDKLKDLIWHLVLPVTATVAGSLAALSMYTRSSMIEIMSETYVLT
ncbi:MAG: ABC transporter permease, partial [Candidatus Omnitrophica bacterium]|nr:ABC transporter permease [Candidatus Omnitrophota bacterium]